MHPVRFRSESDIDIIALTGIEIRTEIFSRNYDILVCNFYYYVIDSKQHVNAHMICPFILLPVGVQFIGNTCKHQLHFF